MILGFLFSTVYFFRARLLLSVILSFPVFFLLAFHDTNSRKRNNAKKQKKENQSERTSTADKGKNKKLTQKVSLAAATASLSRSRPPPPREKAEETEAVVALSLTFSAFLLLGGTVHLLLDVLEPRRDPLELRFVLVEVDGGRSGQRGEG